LQNNSLKRWTISKKGF